MILVISLLGMAETALTQVGLHRVQRMLAGDQGDEAFTPEEQARLLTTLLMLRSILILMLGALTALWAVRIVPGPAYLLACLCLTTLVLVGIEVLGRRYARVHSDAIVAKTLSLLRKVNLLLSPLVNLIFLLTNPLSPGEDKLPLASLQDLHEEILELKSQGLLEEADTEMIESLFELGETIAREVMVPRVDMICAQVGTSLGDVVALMKEHGFSRIPVYQDSIDTILGFVHVKDLLTDIENSTRPVTREDLREVLVVPGTKKVVEILRELQSENLALAVVLDEYGGTDGLLTLEDIVEEIVGDINDEYDQEVADLEMQSDGSAIVDAKMILEDVNESLGLDIPVDEHETLGGFVYGQLGRVPKPDETIELEGLRLTVVDVNRRRITRVRVERLGIEENVA
ncbi:MAG: hemolysin family protein [Vulcanimicrobiota bacterium]